MSTPPPSQAFDAHAPGYDNVALSALGTVLRSRVHTIVEQHLSPDATVLDVGCGSGIDTAWLAKRARSVHAIDPSPGMTAHTRSRCADTTNVTVETVAALDLTLEEPVDLVLANFGAINCVGPLDEAGRAIAQWLRPGGTAIIVTMPTICPLERAVAVATRNRALWQRRRSGPVHDHGYDGLIVTYANATQLNDGFDELDLVAAESLGLVLPPFEQRARVESRPRLLNALATADTMVSQLGGRLGWGDHLVTTFRRSAAGGTS